MGLPCVVIPFSLVFLISDVEAGDVQFRFLSRVGWPYRPSFMGEHDLDLGKDDLEQWFKKTTGCETVLMFRAQPCPKNKLCTTVVRDNVSITTIQCPNGKLFKQEGYRKFKTDSAEQGFEVKAVGLGGQAMQHGVKTGMVLIESKEEKDYAFTDEDGSPQKVWRLKFRTEPPMFMVGDLVTDPTKRQTGVGTVVAANQNNHVLVRFGTTSLEGQGNELEPFNFRIGDHVKSKNNTIKGWIAQITPDGWVQIQTPTSRITLENPDTLEQDEDPRYKKVKTDDKEAKHQENDELDWSAYSDVFPNPGGDWQHKELTESVVHSWSDAVGITREEIDFQRKIAEGNSIQSAFDDHHHCNTKPEKDFLQFFKSHGTGSEIKLRARVEIPDDEVITDAKKYEYVTVTHGVPYYTERRTQDGVIQGGGGCFVTKLPFLPRSNESNTEVMDARAVDKPEYYQRGFDEGNGIIGPNPKYDPRISLTAFHAAVWRSLKFGAKSASYYTRERDTRLNSWVYTVDTNQRFNKKEIPWPSENDRWQTPIVAAWERLTDPDGPWKKQKEKEHPELKDKFPYTIGFTESQLEVLSKSQDWVCESGSTPSFGTCSRCTVKNAQVSCKSGNWQKDREEKLFEGTIVFPRAQPVLPKSRLSGFPKEGFEYVAVDDDVKRKHLISREIDKWITGCWLLGLQLMNARAQDDDSGIAIDRRHFGLDKHAFAYAFVVAQGIQHVWCDQHGWHDFKWYHTFGNSRAPLTQKCYYQMKDYTFGLWPALHEKRHKPGIVVDQNLQEHNIWRKEKKFGFNRGSQSWFRGGDRGKVACKAVDNDGTAHEPDFTGFLALARSRLWNHKLMASLLRRTHDNHEPSFEKLDVTDYFTRYRHLFTSNSAIDSRVDRDSFFSHWHAVRAETLDFEGPGRFELFHYFLKMCWELATQVGWSDANGVIQPGDAMLGPSFHYMSLLVEEWPQWDDEKIKWFDRLRLVEAIECAENGPDCEEMRDDRWYSPGEQDENRRRLEMNDDWRKHEKLRQSATSTQS